MDIPFFGLDRQYRQYRKKFLDITDRVLSTGAVLQGKDVQLFEEHLCRITGRKEAVAVGSCTDALAFALLAAGIQPGDEVLITAFSFFASVSPIVRVGAVPRFVDIDPDYYMMDPTLLEGLLTPKTRAVLAVHIFGQMLPINVLEDFCRRHNLILIEDAAQALGIGYESRSAGSMGLASCLSFDPTKVVGSFSSAGALVSNDPQVCDTVRALRYHGRNPKTRRYEMLGYNSQLSTEMAAMLSFKLSHLEEWIRERQRVARVYHQCMEGTPQVILPKVRPGSGHNWHKYVLQVKDREALAQYLKQKGVQTMLHYPNALCDEPLIQGLNLPPEAVNVPTTRRAAGQVLSLPIYPELSNAEAEYVAGCIKAFYEEDL